MVPLPVRCRIVNMTPVEALIIAIVEGLTEFLPVSSTGHMILASSCLGLEHDAFQKSFEISIQLGAILAIAWIYARRFLRSIELYKKLVVAFLPTAIVGLAAYGWIKQYLFSPMVVTVSLIAGGIVLLFLDRRVVASRSSIEQLEHIPYRNAFGIGLVQGISVIPGVSRAAATIIGGVFNGLDRRQATEFSFLLAVPTMFAATGYDLLRTGMQFSRQELMLLALGLVASFVFAWIAVKLLLSFVERHGFAVFGWYRIALGLLFALLIQQGIIR